MDDDLRAGIALFDLGRHWDAHERWETAWRADPRPERDCWKGLIQIAAACFHLARGNRRPVAWLLGRARHHLSVHDTAPWSLDRESLLELIEELAECAPGDPLPHLGRCLR